MYTCTSAKGNDYHSQIYVMRLIDCCNGSYSLFAKLVLSDCICRSCVKIIRNQAATISGSREKKFGSKATSWKEVNIKENKGKLASHIIEYTVVSLI